MFESKYSNLLTTLLIIGIVLIIGVILFMGFTTIKNNELKNDAEDAVDQFQGQINEIEDENIIIEGNEITNEITPIIGIENIVINNNSNTNTNTSTYKGFPMVGTIEIPATNLKCPILAQSEYSPKALETAVVETYGPGLNQIGVTTISGHNYRNGTFFSNNKKLNVGDKIYITDLTGKRLTYTIYDKFEAEENYADYMVKDTQGAIEIALSTCTDNSKARLIILAKADV